MVSSPSNSLRSPLSPEPIQPIPELNERLEESKQPSQQATQHRKPIGGVAVLPPIGSKKADEKKEQRTSQLIYDYEPGRRSTLDHVSVEMFDATKCSL